MPINEEDRKPKHHHHNKPRPNMPHVHTYLTEVDVADDHQHIILGVSGPARERTGSWSAASATKTRRPGPWLSLDTRCS